VAPGRPRGHREVPVRTTGPGVPGAVPGGPAADLAAPHPGVAPGHGPRAGRYVPGQEGQRCWADGSGCKWTIQLCTVFNSRTARARESDSSLGHGLGGALSNPPQQGRSLHRPCPGGREPEAPVSRAPDPPPSFPLPCSAGPEGTTLLGDRPPRGQDGFGVEEAQRRQKIPVSDRSRLGNIPR
jgi:hypothetical protein